MTQGQDASACIKSNGWRQGSVLPRSVVDAMRRDGQLSESVAECDTWIVVTHDCDVTNSNLDAEPFVEIVPARIVDGQERDGNKHWGKNPRKLQFIEKRDGVDVHYEISIHDLVRIPRHHLAGASPDMARSLNHECIKVIIRWIAKRYFRASFPDAFNERTRQAANELRKQFKRNGHLISGIYILVQDDELSDDEDYDVTVWATMRDDKYEQISVREEAQRLVDQLESQFGSCKGLSIAAVELRAESDVSLSDLNWLKRWDFDDLSLREHARSEMPPPPT